MRIVCIFIFLFVSLVSQAQEVQELCINPKFEKTIDKYIDRSVRIIGVHDLKDSLEEFTILDTRELEEYNISHIPGAIHFGYDDPNFELSDHLNPDANIVVYCSIGYRSEKIGEKLQKRGFKNVANLYGSIFEWANNNNILEDKEGNETLEVHTYNRMWSKWVNNENIIKVY